MKVKVNNRFKAEHLPCDPRYFQNYIKDKPLEVIGNYRSMVRVKDQSGSEWSLFRDEYNVWTGL